MEVTYRNTSGRHLETVTKSKRLYAYVTCGCFWKDSLNLVLAFSREKRTNGKTHGTRTQNFVVGGKGNTSATISDLMFGLFIHEITLLPLHCYIIGYRILSVDCLVCA